MNKHIESVLKLGDSVFIDFLDMNKSRSTSP